MKLQLRRVFASSGELNVILLMMCVCKMPLKIGCKGKLDCFHFHPSRAANISATMFRHPATKWNYISISQSLSAVTNCEYIYQNRARLGERGR